MLQKITITNAIMAIILIAQFSGQDSSVEGKEKPHVNFFGKLTDTNGQKYEVENITISGMYKQIPVYQKPSDPSMSPDINITRLDLSEISQIKTVIAQPQTTTQRIPKIVTYNKREYIEIEIISRDDQKTHNNYIIEKTKKIYCDEKNQAGPIEKELSFQALDSLTIDGYNKAPLKNKNKNDSCDLVTTQTKTIILKLEEKVQELPNQPTTAKSIKDSILNYLNDLKISLKRWL